MAPPGLELKRNCFEEIPLPLSHLKRLPSCRLTVWLSCCSCKYVNNLNLTQSNSRSLYQNKLDLISILFKIVPDSRIQGEVAFARMDLPFPSKNHFKFVAAFSNSILNIKKLIYFYWITTTTTTYFTVLNFNFNTLFKL